MSQADIRQSVHVNPEGNPEAARDVVLAALLFCRNPIRLGGLAVSAHAGPVRELLLEFIRNRILAGSALAWKKLPLHIQDERLLGGIDLTATLKAGRPILQQGLLSQADGGVILMPMAERAGNDLIARLVQVMDRHEVVVQREGLSAVLPARFGLIALDESDGTDEALSVVLKDRLGLHLDLSQLRLADLQAAIAELDDDDGLDDSGQVSSDEIIVSEEALTALCATALALGIDSIRASLFALLAARTLAQMFGRSSVSQEDLVMAARMVLAPRATRLPSQEPDESDANEDEMSDPPEPSQNSDEQENEHSLPNREEPDQLQDVVLDAAKAAIPADLLASLLMMSSRSRSSRQGRSGARIRGGQRGRPVGTIAGMPDGKRKLSLIDTLRAAAPWQRLRASAPVTRARIHIRQEDFRIRRFEQRTETTTIFVVDASGSSALHRLAEAKGAVELLLADCYVRRDQVAVIAFRGKSAELVLPPTRSLVRAKRSLSGMPGGGGTPLASAIDAAYTLSQSVLRRGETPIIVLLTDAKANVSRDGTPGRALAQQEALAAASLIRACGINTILVDTSATPSEMAQELSARMNARYLALPHAGAAEVVQAVKSLS